jgi:hypothetical protein
MRLRFCESYLTLLVHVIISLVKRENVVFLVLLPVPEVDFPGEEGGRSSAHGPALCT